MVPWVPSAHLARWFAAQAQRVGARVVAAVSLGPKPSDYHHDPASPAATAYDAVLLPGGRRG